MKLIIAGTRPPEYIVKNVKKYAEWMMLLSEQGVVQRALRDEEAYHLRYQVLLDGIWKAVRPSWGHEMLMLTAAGCEAYLDSTKLPYEFINEVVSGVAYGPDHLGEAIANSYSIPIRRFPADWKNNGKAAGMIRNREMADYADALYLLWDGKSNGSKNMKAEMEKRKKKVYELVIEDWTLGVK